MEQCLSNPAFLFLKNPQDVESPEHLVQNYAHYLLKEANAYRFPVELATIRQHFPFPVFCKLLPQESRGFITDDLRIYLNSADRLSVRRFTLAHEFMETLFLALKEGAADGWMKDQLFEDLQKRKEILCEIGAAELWMPLPLFRKFVSQFPMSLKLAQKIAIDCKLSLITILRRMVETGLSSIALIMWRYECSSSKKKAQSKKMRVRRCFTSPDLRGYVPRGKSVPLTSSIHQAFVERTAKSDFEELDLVGIRGRYFVESLPYNIAGEQQVISLVHLN